MVGGRVFLYPGQGSQFPGMAADLFERYESVKSLFERASDVCRTDMADLLFSGTDDQLKATENAQTAIVLASLASREALAAEGIHSDAAAGHSLGEYSALVDAATLTAEDALLAVSARGKHMAAAAATIEKELGATGMAAVIGLGPKAVRDALEEFTDVWSANENGPSQVVIAGTLDGMNAAEDALKKAGARRVIPLKVSGPFHTPLMQDAASALAETLAGLNFRDPEKQVWSNVTAGLIESGEQARELLVRQITGSVIWVDLTVRSGCYPTLIDFRSRTGKGSERLMGEIGPGRILSPCRKRRRSGEYQTHNIGGCKCF